MFTKGEWRIGFDCDFGQSYTIVMTGTDALHKPSAAYGSLMYQVGELWYVYARRTGIGRGEGVAVTHRADMRRCYLAKYVRREE